MLKTIERDGRTWAWPTYDTELIRVFDQVRDLDQIMGFVSGRGVCVQAGGACGVWPARLSELFDVVYTFEPDAVNFQALAANAPHAIKFQAALSDRNGAMVEVRRVSSEATNCGAGYTVGTAEGFIPTLTIDTIARQPVDLIALDVEGAEVAALLGARATIACGRPTIVIEEKALPQGGDHLEARRLLESWGYREAARVHRDVVFTPTC